MAEPTPDELKARLERLRAAAPALRARSTGEILEVMGRVGARFLHDGDPLRRRALAELPSEAGLSAPMARVVLDGMARDWTADRLASMVEAEFGGPGPLDGWVEPVGAGRAVMAVGPSLCVQIVSGSVPGVSVHALLRSLAVKAPTLLKPGRGDALLAELFAEGLREEDPAMAAALEVVYWPGGSAELEDVALQTAEVVVVYGSDATVRSLRARAPATTRVVGYHHRVGVGVVGRGALGNGERADAGGAVDVAAGVARAVALFEQRGCVCPQVVWVEEGGEVTPPDFARLVAEALDALEAELPSASPNAHAAAALRQLRDTAEMSAASGAAEVRHGGEAPWTVLYEPEPLGGLEGAGRLVRIRPLDDAARLDEKLESLGPHLQSVGHAGLGGRVRDIGARLGKLGASRFVPFQALSFPPPWWMHDGRGPLRDLVRWIEVEGGGE